MTEEPIEIPEIVEEEEPTGKKNNKTLWIILIVVGVLLILCCCAVLVAVGVGLTEDGWLIRLIEDMSFIAPMLV